MRDAYLYSEASFYYPIPMTGPDGKLFTLSRTSSDEARDQARGSHSGLEHILLITLPILGAQKHVREKYMGRITIVTELSGGENADSDENEMFDCDDDVGFELNVSMNRTDKKNVPLQELASAVKEFLDTAKLKPYPGHSEASIFNMIESYSPTSLPRSR